MLKLVDYDSSDDADCSGNDEEEMDSPGNKPMDNDEVIFSIVKDLLNTVCGEEKFGSGEMWTEDRRGYSYAISGPSTKVKSEKRKIRRKRRYGEMRQTESSTDWSGTDSWSSDTSSSSSTDTTLDDAQPRRRSGTAPACQVEPNLSEDSDYVYARILLDCQKRRQYGRTGIPKAPPKTKGELDLDDLPPIEDLYISVPEKEELRKVGIVSSIVGKLAVVQADYGVPPLDEETWLVNESRLPIGQVFEIFGPVPRPFYSIRFNCAEDATQRLSIGSVVYFIPHNEKFTRTVFADTLRLVKGSDASWEDNNEPPPEVVEFSDDEEERRWKAIRRGKVPNSTNEPGTQESQEREPESQDSEGNKSVRPKAIPRRSQRNRGRGNNHNPYGSQGSGNNHNSYGTQGRTDHHSYEDQGRVNNYNSYGNYGMGTTVAMQNPWASFHTHRPSPCPSRYPSRVQQSLSSFPVPEPRFQAPVFRTPFRPGWTPGSMQQMIRVAGGAGPSVGHHSSPPVRAPIFTDRRFVQNNG